MEFKLTNLPSTLSVALRAYRPLLQDDYNTITPLGLKVMGVAIGVFFVAFLAVNLPVGIALGAGLGGALLVYSCAYIGNMAKRGYNYRTSLEQFSGAARKLTFVNPSENFGVEQPIDDKTPYAPLTDDERAAHIAFINLKNFAPNLQGELVWTVHESDDSENEKAPFVFNQERRPYNNSTIYIGE